MSIDALDPNQQSTSQVAAHQLQQQNGEQQNQPPAEAHNSQTIDFEELPLLRSVSDGEAGSHAEQQHAEPSGRTSMACLW